MDVLNLFQVCAIEGEKYVVNHATNVWRWKSAFC